MESQTFVDIITNPIIIIPIGIAFIILTITFNHGISARASKKSRKVALVINVITSVILIGTGILWLYFTTR